MCGLGVGLLTNGVILDYELRKPIGEDEPIETPSNVTEKPKRPEGPKNTKEGLRIDLRGSQGYSRSNESLNYARYFENSEAEAIKASEESPKDSDEDDSDAAEFDEEEPIFQITLDEYVTAESASYDKIAVTYYEGDDTYALSSNDTMLPAFEDHIGTEPLIFDDEDNAYIRNENERTDYEVHRVEMGFVEAAYGITNDDDVKPRPKIRKMREDGYD